MKFLSITGIYIIKSTTHGNDWGFFFLMSDEILSQNLTRGQ